MTPTQCCARVSIILLIIASTYIDACAFAGPLAHARIVTFCTHANLLDYGLLKDIDDV